MLSEVNDESGPVVDRFMGAWEGKFLVVGK